MTVSILTGRARLLIECCSFLHHQTKGKVTVEIIRSG